MNSCYFLASFVIVIATYFNKLWTYIFMKNVRQWIIRSSLWYFGPLKIRRKCNFKNFFAVWYSRFWWKRNFISIFSTGFRSKFCANLRQLTYLYDVITFNKAILQEIEKFSNFFCGRMCFNLPLKAREPANSTIRSCIVFVTLYS